MLKSLIATGELQYLDGTWVRRKDSSAPGGFSFIPRSVQDAVKQRADRLSAAAKQALTLAAVAGRRFDFPLLQEVLHCDEDQLLPLMKELIAAQLVVEESADQFAFRHALIRQAIYSELLARELRMLHQTIAETMEQQPPVTPDLHLEDLAYHFYQARDWQKAVDYAQRAGEKALRLYAHRAAIDYFTWVVEAADRLSPPPSPASYRARGQAHETLGEFEQAQHDYTRALDAARTMHDRVAEWQSTIE